jgi:ligand-binding sensor domain-containing protein
MKNIFRLVRYKGFFFVLFFLSTNTNPLHARWIQTYGFYDGVHTFAVSGTNLFAGTEGGVFLSTNNGASWSAVNTGLNNTNVRALAVYGTNLFAGTYGGGVFRSTNNGTNWYVVNTGLIFTQVQALAVSGTNLFAGTYIGGVFLFDNNSLRWTPVNNGLTDTYVYALAVSGTNLFAGTYTGVFHSTNNGTSWTSGSIGLTDPYVNALAISGTNLIAGTGSGGIFLSTNNGSSWTEVIKTALTVEGLSTNLPIKYSLEQNFPNPFNPETTISFSLPLKSFVSLKVFDALGREVSVVLSEELPAGKYSRKWNAAGLPSGVYFCRLQVGSFTEAKKICFAQMKQLQHNPRLPANNTGVSLTTLNKLTE